METAIEQTSIDTRSAFIEARRLHLEGDLSVIKACKRVGIARPTYYLYLKNEREALPQIEKAKPASSAPLSPSPEGSDDSAVISITRDQKSSPDQK